MIILLIMEYGTISTSNFRWRHAISTASTPCMFMETQSGRSSELILHFCYGASTSTTLAIQCMPAI